MMTLIFVMAPLLLLQLEIRTLLEMGMGMQMSMKTLIGTPGSAWIDVASASASFFAVFSDAVDLL
jgi:hypothetical protein